MKHEGLFTAYRIAEVRTENSKTRTLIFDAPMGGVQPGQYVMVWLPGCGEKPFSISGDAPLAITAADVGPFSHTLTQLGKGDPVWVRGSFGKGFALQGEKHLLVGGGYGAAPLSLLASHALGEGHEVAVALGARTESDLMMVSIFEDMGCKVYLVTEDGSAGLKGLVTVVLEDALTDWQPETLYACGPNPMLMRLAAFAREKNMPAQLSFEALIRCGIGLCGSCELPEEICKKIGIPSGFLVCHDGPVVKI